MKNSIGFTYDYYLFIDNISQDCKEDKLNFKYIYNEIAC